MRAYKIFFISLFLILPFVLTGCISVKNGPEVGSSGGFFLTPDSEKWANRSAIYTANGEVKTFSGANITSIALDPEDEAAIYLGTQTNGIYYSYNYGQGWTNTLAGQGTINDIVVHPKDKCNIYAAVYNKIWYSEDCSRTWDTLYFEARANKFVTALEINYSNPDIVYAGTNEGSFLRSLDKGKSWEVLYRFQDDVQDIVVQNHSDSNIIYVLTKSKGAWRSNDGGLNWEDLMELPVYELENVTENGKTFTKIKKVDEAKPFFKVSGVKLAVAVASDRTKADSLIYANRIGMFRFNGEYWEQYKLLTPKNKETIYSVAVNPKDGNDIYYGTSAALYHTIDNGANWIIKELPTTRAAGELNFSANSQLLYLGSYKIEK
ncbi:hypothetical protein H6761_01545 [Candidatus Nomurabacteria bacterium]|nr:hypothetical protein [Candidatus Nomurabacteria bacterium]